MDYINGGARDIERRKEVGFLSYLEGIRPYARSYKYMRVHMSAHTQTISFVEGSFI